MKFEGVDKDTAHFWGKLRYIEWDSGSFNGRWGSSDIGVLHHNQYLDKISLAFMFEN